MEKTCLNCKYYYNRQCNNKTLPIEPESNIEDITTEFIEEGILSGSLQELLTNKELKKLNNINRIKKIMEENKNYTVTSISKELTLSKSYVSKLIKEILS